MVDPFVPPHPHNVPIDGDGNISVFQFHNGKVDLKTRYIDTERLKLERKANKAMFGLYRNLHVESRPRQNQADDETVLR
jgi:carotenoid cleavage dioxygenase-like enzyme